MERLQGNVLIGIGTVLRILSAVTDEMRRVFWEAGCEGIIRMTEAPAGTVCVLEDTPCKNTEVPAAPLKFLQE